MFVSFNRKFSSPQVRPWPIISTIRQTTLCDSITGELYGDVHIKHGMEVGKVHYSRRATGTPSTWSGTWNLHGPNARRVVGIAICPSLGHSCKIQNREYRNVALHREMLHFQSEMPPHNISTVLPSVYDARAACVCARMSLGGFVYLGESPCLHLCDPTETPSRLDLDILIITAHRPKPVPLNDTHIETHSLNR